jgi:hypothetical protein
MKGKTILACIIILLFSLSMHKVMAPPLPPCAFYGYVSVGGKPAPDGLKVTAVVGGATLNWTTETRGGTYGWGAKGSSDFYVPSDNSDTLKKDGAAAGDWVEFYVQGIKNVETAPFESMGAKRFDLSIPELPEQPETKPNSTLTISLDCPSAFAGYKVKINGRLAYTNGTDISGAILSLKYMVASGRSWIDIASVNTITDGYYYAEWTPNATGSYLIKVSWEGNKTVEGAEANISLAATSPEEKYVFSVISNSTISGLTYNTTNRALSFALTGPNATTGYTNVTIAKELIGEITGLKVYLDESIVYYTANSNDASWLLHFTYQQSGHKVTVNLSPPATPFIETPLGIAALAVIVVAVAVGLTYMVRRKQKQPEKANSQEDKPRKSSEKRRPPPWKFEKKESHGPK